MGERMLRPGIRDSERMSALVREVGWIGHSFFTCLLTVVDDYGRYDARPAILRPILFPLLIDLVREADVQRCVTACDKSGLIRLYRHDGKPYLEVNRFKQRLRAKSSKWPPPPAGNCPDIAVTMPTETETETETEIQRCALSAGKPPQRPPRKPKEIRKPATGPHAEVIAYFVGKWATQHGETYPFKAADGVQAAAVLKAAAGDVAKAKCVIDRYFADPFYQGHPLATLGGASVLPRFLVEDPNSPEARGRRVAQRMESK